MSDRELAMTNFKKTMLFITALLVICITLMFFFYQAYIEQQYLLRSIENITPESGWHTAISNKPLDEFAFIETDLTARDQQLFMSFSFSFDMESTNIETIYWENKQWHNMSLNSTISGVVNSFRTKIASDGSVYVAYGPDNDGTVYLKRWANANWDDIGFISIEAYRWDIALSSENVPYIVWSADDHLGLATWPATSDVSVPATVMIEPTSQSYKGNVPQMIFGPNDELYVMVWHTQTDIHVLRWQNGWENLGEFKSKPNYLGWASILVDDDNQLYLGLSQPNESVVIMKRQPENQNWEKLPPAHANLQAFSGYDMTLNQNGEVFLAYTLEDELFVTKLQEDNWVLIKNQNSGSSKIFDDKDRYPYNIDFIISSSGKAYLSAVITNNDMFVENVPFVFSWQEN